MLGDVDVVAEYAALRDAAGVVDGTHQMVIAEGPDTIRFLNDLLSQEVAGMPLGGVAQSLLLGPQGKLRALLWLLRGEDRVAMIADAGIGQTVLDDLSQYMIRVKLTMELDRRPMVDLIGPGAEEVLARAGLTAPPGWSEIAGTLVTRAPLGDHPRFIVAGEGAGRLEEAGAVVAGPLAWRAVRVEAGEPVMGVDVDERTIPQEAGLVENAVSFTKGCYLGQELVARIDTRGHVNRLLRGLVVEVNLLPPEGARVWVDDRQVGAITSVAESLTVRAPVGLGLLRREVAPGDRVEVRWDGGSAPARVSELPLVGGGY
jgi:tRNA-modifying protein YgfZ